MDDSLRQRHTLKNLRSRRAYDSDDNGWMSDEDTKKKVLRMDENWRHFLDSETGTIKLKYRESIGERPVWEFFSHEIVLDQTSKTYKYTIVIDGHDHEDFDVDEWYDWKKTFSQEGLWTYKKNESRESIHLFDSRAEKRQFAVALDEIVKRPLQNIEIVLSRPFKTLGKKSHENHDPFLQNVAVVSSIVIIALMLIILQLREHVEPSSEYEYEIPMEFVEDRGDDHIVSDHFVKGRKPYWH